MAAKNKGLGRGLGALLGEEAVARPTEEAKEPSGKEALVKTRLVEPNRNQPRKDFSDEELNELAESIRIHGVIQPLIVVRKGDHYEIVAGERRWRAAKMAGLKEIPVLIREYTEENAAEIALIENIQRKDLNPIEEAEAYKKLIDDYHLTQEALSERLSKSRTNITNALRLLKLPAEIRDMLKRGEISTGHAKVLLGLPDEQKQIEIARRVTETNASVRDTETLVERAKKPEKPKKVAKELPNEVAYREAEDDLTKTLGTKVSIHRSGVNKGKIEIEFYSLEDFERISSHIR